MLAPKFIPLVLKQIVRHRTRTLLTLAGVATAMFLFSAVQAMQEGVEAATQSTAADTTLVVYRQNRFCPATSRLPEHYLDRIRRIVGVQGAVPMKIEVTNCRTSLDVVTFRGVPPDHFESQYAPSLTVASGSVADWTRRADAALLGESLAKRRGLQVGDRFDALGINVFVAGVIRSDQPQDMNVAYVHLPFLQRSSGAKKLGVVTQFNVKVKDPALLGPVAAAIDEEFRRDPEPTQTSPEKAFVGRAAADVVQIVAFTRWLGWGSLAAVLALVANAIVLSVQDRRREHAVFQTLGFTGGLMARLIVAEGALLGSAGGLIGSVGAFALVRYGRYSLSSEGMSIQATTGPGVLFGGLLVAAALGMLAGAFPAWQVSRRQITESFRAV